MLGHDLDQCQWRQCLGVMDITSTVAGAYYASLLVCLPAIGEIDLAQSLSLSPTLFGKDGTPHQTNLYRELLQPLHVGVHRVYDEAMEIDRTLSLKVLESLPVSITQAPGSITQAEKDSRHGSKRPSDQTFPYYADPHFQGQ